MTQLPTVNFWQRCKISIADAAPTAQPERMGYRRSYSRANTFTWQVLSDTQASLQAQTSANNAAATHKFLKVLPAARLNFI